MTALAVEEDPAKKSKIIDNSSVACSINNSINLDGFGK